MIISNKQIMQLISCVRSYSQTLTILISKDLASNNASEIIDAMDKLTLAIINQQSEQLHEVE